MYDFQTEERPWTPTMKMWLGASRLLLALAVTLIVASVAGAQEVACEDGTAGAPWIGVHTFHCPGGTCSVAQVWLASSKDGSHVTDANSRRSESAYEFSAEPWLWGIDSGGPAAGNLEEGDVLVAVNGYLITSKRGGAELGNLPVTEDAVLTVRRDERLLETVVRPVQRCERPLAVSGNTVVRMPTDSSNSDRPRWKRTTIGLSFRCEDCDFSVDQEGRVHWENPKHLEILSVEQDSAGDDAGLRPGDILVSVDGLDLESPAASELLLNPEVGTTLDLGVGRGGLDLVLNLVVPISLEQRDPRENFVLHRGGSWGSPMSWFNNAELQPEFAMIISGESWAPSVYGAMFDWCDDCSWSASPQFTWTMSEYPAVESIEDGGAAQDAGLQVGDVLTHVDDQDLQTDAGGSAFINLRAGERVEIRFRRDGRERSAMLVAGEVIRD